MSSRFRNSSRDSIFLNRKAAPIFVTKTAAISQLVACPLGPVLVQEDRGESLCLSLSATESYGGKYGERESTIMGYVTDSSLQRCILLHLMSGLKGLLCGGSASF